MGTQGDGLNATIISVTLGFLLLGGFIIFFIVLNRFKINKHINEKRQMENMFSQTLLQTQLEIQEQTLKIVSQEIHDNIGQVLSLAKLHLNTIDNAKPDLLVQKIISSKELVGKAIQDLRDLSKSLNPDTIAGTGLLRAIEHELDSIRKAGLHDVIFEGGNVTLKTDAAKELILFRIVQEILNNIIRHADATHITVQARLVDNQFELTIADNGKGFHFAPLSVRDPAAGMGLRNMHSRATLIGARFNLQSIPGQGTHIQIKLPVHE